MVVGQTSAAGLTALPPAEPVLKFSLEAATTRNPNTEVSPAKGIPMTLHCARFPRVQVSH
jgi:hypothetical protein